MHSLVFNYNLQSTLENIKCGTQLFLMNHVAFSPMNLPRLCVSCAPCSPRWTKPKNQEGSNQDSWRAIRLYWEKMECGPGFNFESFCSHEMEQSLVGRSKVHHQSADEPKGVTQLPKLSKCSVRCSVSLLKERKREEIFQWQLQPPTPSHKLYFSSESPSHPNCKLGHFES